MLFGFGMILFSLCLSTIFSDSKISTQVGSLILLAPLAIFISLFNIDWANPVYLYYGYMLPFFPAVILTGACLGINLGLNLTIAWVALIVSLPVYYAFYIYLDQIIPDTFGIAKSCCFCLKRSRARRND